MAADSLEQHVVRLYKQLSYPPFQHFRRVLREEHGIRLEVKTLKSFLLNAGIRYPISANRRVLKAVRKQYQALSVDNTWVGGFSRTLLFP